MLHRALCAFGVTLSLAGAGGLPLSAQAPTNDSPPHPQTRRAKPKPTETGR